MSFGTKDFKYFFGYKDAKNNKNFMYIPSENECTLDFDKTKCISFLIKHEKLIEKYNKI